MSNDSLMWAVTAANGSEPIQLPKPQRVRDTDILIRVHRVGICGTDREILNGYAGFQGILGHEFSGEVVESDLYAWIRRRVTAHINIPGEVRGTLDYAAAKHDPQRRAIGIRGRDGAMAEYIVLPEGLLVALPDNVSDAAGAMAEPLAAAMDGVSRLPADTGPVLIVGDGRLAQLSTRVLRSYKREVHAVGRHDRKLGKLREAGVTILDELPERAYSGIIETSGRPSGLEIALNAVAPEATIILKSTHTETITIDPSRLAVDEIRLVGSRCGDVEQAVARLSEGVIEVEDLIDAVFPLREAEQAFARAFDGDALKIQLDPRY